LSFSYNSGNPLANTQLFDFLNSQNLQKTIKIDYRKNVMSQMTTTQKWLPTEEKYQEISRISFFAPKINLKQNPSIISLV
jgi:hypothetical protein